MINRNNDVLQGDETSTGSNRVVILEPPYLKYILIVHTIMETDKAELQPEKQTVLNCKTSNQNEIKKKSIRATKITNKINHVNEVTNY